MPSTSIVLRAAGALTVLGALGACGGAPETGAAGTGASPTSTTPAPGAGASTSQAARATPSASRRAGAVTSTPATRTTGASAVRPTRAAYCGPLTAVDPARGQVTIHAYMSYRFAGDIYDAQPEDTSFTLPVSGGVEVVELTSAVGTSATGDRAARLRTAERLAKNERRAYVHLADNGQVETITLGIKSDELSGTGCYNGS
jgi:hypothetical protein